MSTNRFNNLVFGLFGNHIKGNTRLTVFDYGIFKICSLAKMSVFTVRCND